MLGEILIAGMAAMLICIFLGPKFIEYLRLREFGQQIREEGPEEHHEKAGTPTMGGLIIFTAISIPYLVLSDRSTASLAVFGVALGCALIGFIDDFLKITRRRSLGLSARYKLVFQAALALGLWYVARHSVGLDSSLELRISDASLDIPDWLYPIVILAVLVAVLVGLEVAGQGLDQLLRHLELALLGLLRLGLLEDLAIEVLGGADLVVEAHRRQGERVVHRADRRQMLLVAEHEPRDRDLPCLLHRLHEEC